MTRYKGTAMYVKSDIKGEWTHLNSVGAEFLNWDHQVGDIIWTNST